MSSTSDKPTPTPQQRLGNRRKAQAEAREAGCGPTMLRQHAMWVREAELACVPDAVRKAAQVVAEHLVGEWAENEGLDEENFGFDRWRDDATQEVTEAIALGEEYDLNDLEVGSYDEQKLIDEARVDAEEARADSREGIGYAEGLRGANRYDVW